MYTYEVKVLDSRYGWQTSRGHKGQTFVDKKGEFSWTLLVNSRGHFCPREVLFLGEFLWTFSGEFSRIFFVNFHGHFF